MRSGSSTATSSATSTRENRGPPSDAAALTCAGIAGTTIGPAGRTSSGITEGSVAASRYFTLRMPPVAAASAAMNRSAAG